MISSYMFIFVKLTIIRHSWVRKARKVADACFFFFLMNITF